MVAEFTTAQAVLFLCAAIVLFGAAFVAGRLVAHVDRPIDLAAQPAPPDTGKADGPAAQPSSAPAKEQAAQTTQVKTGPTQTYSIPAMEAGAGTPAQSAQPSTTAPKTAATPAPATPAPAAPATTAPAPASPAPAAPAPAQPAVTSAPVEEAAPAAAPPAAAPAPAAPPQPTQVIPVPPVSQPAAAAKASPLLANTKKRLTDLPPLPSNHESAAPTPVPVEKPKTPEAQPIQVAAAAPAAQEKIVAVDPPPAEPAHTNPAAPPPAKATAEGPAAAPSTTAATPADKTVSTAKTGTFAVQLGSFDGPQRQARAQSLQKHIKKDYGLNAKIENSEKEKISRVVLTGYADKNSASAACAELRKKSGMSGAFVRAI